MRPQLLALGRSWEAQLRPCVCATLSTGCTMAEPRAASLGQSATPGTGLAAELSLCPLMCRLLRSSSLKMGSG